MHDERQPTRVWNFLDFVNPSNDTWGPYGAWRASEIKLTATRGSLNARLPSGPGAAGGGGPLVRTQEKARLRLKTSKGGAGRWLYFVSTRTMSPHGSRV